MAKPKLTQVVVFGVDLPENGSPDGPVSLSTVQQILAVFRRYQISATWATPAFNSAVVDCVRAASPNQEVALLWNEAPVTRLSETFPLAARLRDRFHAAQANGLQIQSIAADAAGMLPYETLARLGFRSLRPTRPRQAMTVRDVQPQSLRHGLWGMPVSCFWPVASRWSWSGSMRNVLVQNRLAAQRGQAVHIVFDLARLQAGGSAEIAQVERLCQQTDQLRSECGLRVCRLADVDWLVRAETTAQPARSILRRIA